MEEQKTSNYPKSFPEPPGELDNEKLTKILQTELTSWRHVKSPLPEDPFIERQELFREFKFDDFDKVLSFMNKVGEGCNIFPHHPRWENIWTTLKVWLSTWDGMHIISYKDIMLARYMEKIFEEFSSRTIETRTEERIKNERKSFVTKLTELIKDDDLEEAFSQVNTYTAVNTEKTINNELILLTRRYNSVRKSQRKNTQSIEQINQEFNSIASALLETLSELE